jgi:hypothetical protein
MQDVDIMVALTSANPYAIDFMTVQFYQCLVEENLLDKCRAVVLRISHWKGERGFKPITADEVLTKCGLSKDKAPKLQEKLYVVADGTVKQQKKRRSSGKKKAKQQLNETDVAAKFSQLRAHLLGEEVKVAVTAPVKETVSAGKALLSLGQRFSSWVTSLVKS